MNEEIHFDISLKEILSLKIVSVKRNMNLSNDFSEKKQIFERIMFL